MATRTTTADRILAAIPLPITAAHTQTPPSPLPLVELSTLLRDGSMRYAIARLDTSGRIADQSTVVAMGWHPGDALDVAVIASIILISPNPPAIPSASAPNTASLPRKPATAGLAAGDFSCRGADYWAGPHPQPGSYPILPEYYRTVLDQHTAP